MHEYGIVQNLLGQVDEQVRTHNGARAVRVVLAIEAGHVDESFLKDAFDAFKKDTTARDAELVIAQVPLQVWCPECAMRSTVAAGDSTCPRCSAATVPIEPGDEIYLQSVEIEV